MRSVVVADNRLCRLCDGIANREDHREKIASNGECGDTVLTEQRDEHVVTREHHDAHGQFGQKSGKTNACHISRIAQSQQKRGQRPF